MDRMREGERGIQWGGESKGDSQRGRERKRETERDRDRH